uniref:SWIM-type domain-containing protein n=1 Tax=Arundo donax TaxID=35708 RepID=A0A0A9AFA9_ARUDO
MVELLAVPGNTIYTVGFEFKQRREVLFHAEWPSKDDVKCSCRKMERESLPRRHILCVMCHRRTGHAYTGVPRAGMDAEAPR